MPILDEKSLLRVADRYRTKVHARSKALAVNSERGRRAPSARQGYLALALAKERARSAVEEAEATSGLGTAAATIAALARERIVGKSDLLDLNYLELAVAVARGVARVKLPNGAGTGFLVGPGILMTNHHVFPDRETAAKALIQFDYQENNAGELLPIQAFACDASVFATVPELDVTLVGVASLSTTGHPIAEYPWTKLIAMTGKVETGEPINIIQHPLGGLKQIALRGNEVIEVPAGKSDFLYYTTDTQPGSSGAPCFNDQWELVALHHSGVPEKKGESILKKDGKPYVEGRDVPQSISWIANEGARTSAIVEALKTTRWDRRAGEMIEHLLSAPAPNPIELARGAGIRLDPVPPDTTKGDRMTKGRLSIVVNISGDDIESIAIERSESGERARTSVVESNGRPVARALSSSVSPVPLPITSATEPEETTRIDPDWSSREGYDANFLGTRIDLPKLNKEQQEYTFVVPPQYRKREKEKFVLNYHHYSVAFNRKRRLAWYSAANVDGDRRHKFERGKDKWFLDPRIDDPSDPKVQMGEELYAGADTDRGHLTRYLDVAWGDSKADAIAATNDTFHFTNCALQLSGFNQGKDRWQGLEQFLLEQKARKEQRRMVVITGPIFKRNDPRYRNQHMSFSTRLPLSFWKVCALVREDGSLAATGFVLGQPEALDLPDVEEKFEVTAAQVSIAHLGKLTQLDFGVLGAHDHFAESGESTLEVEHDGAPHRVRILEDLEDIII
jgi:endonuclease G, mitochondrial